MRFFNISFKFTNFCLKITSTLPQTVAHSQSLDLSLFLLLFVLCNICEVSNMSSLYLHNCVDINGMHNHKVIRFYSN